MKMRILTFLLLTAAAFGQGSLDVRRMPELGAHVIFDPIPGAVSYNWYEARSYGDCTKGPWVPDHNQLASEPQAPKYDDDPMPGWYLINVEDRGAWQGNWWCYAIAPVYGNGSTGPMGDPAQVRIGANGYVTLHFRKSCSTADIPNPFDFSQLNWKIFYRDPAGPPDHEMNAIQVNNGTNLELEWKAPDIAKDGTIVPLLPKGVYYYELVTPERWEKVGAIMPEYSPDMAAYTQINVYNVLNGRECMVGFGVDGGDYSWPQNVIR